MAEQTTEEVKAEQTIHSTPVKNGRHDVVTHRIVVISLGLTVLTTGLCITILQAMGQEPPASLANLGSTAIGALAMTVASVMRPH